MIRSGNGVANSCLSSGEKRGVRAGWKPASKPLNGSEDFCLLLCLQSGDCSSHSDQKRSEAVLHSPSIVLETVVQGAPAPQASMCSRLRLSLSPKVACRTLPETSLHRRPARPEHVGPLACDGKCVHPEMLRKLQVLTRIARQAACFLQAAVPRNKRNRRWACSTGS